MANLPFWIRGELTNNKAMLDMNNVTPVAVLYILYLFPICLTTIESIWILGYLDTLALYYCIFVALLKGVFHFVPSLCNIFLDCVLFDLEK